MQMPSICNVDGRCIRFRSNSAGMGSGHLMGQSFERRSPEEISRMLNQGQLLEDQGVSRLQTADALGIGRATYYRWRAKFSGMSSEQMEYLLELERELVRLRSMIEEVRNLDMNSAG